MHAASPTTASGGQRNAHACECLPPVSQKARVNATAQICTLSQNGDGAKAYSSERVDHILQTQNGNVGQHVTGAHADANDTWGFKPTSRDPFGLASRGLKHSAKVCSGIAGQSSLRMRRSSCNTLSSGQGLRDPRCPLAKSARHHVTRPSVADSKSAVVCRPRCLQQQHQTLALKGFGFPRNACYPSSCMMQFPHLAFCDHTFEIPEQSGVSVGKCAISQFPIRILRCM